MINPSDGVEMPALGLGVFQSPPNTGVRGSPDPKTIDTTRYRFQVQN